MDVESVNPRHWATAQSRGEILSRMPARPSGAQIRDAMGALGLSSATLFRWLKNFACRLVSEITLESHKFRNISVS